MERIRKIPDDSDRVSPDEDDEDMSPYEPVSYTHLTLPTILLV